MSLLRKVPLEKKDKKLGVSIYRVSTTERARTQHGSLEQQNNRIKRWAKDQTRQSGVKYKIVKEIEEDISGKGEVLHRRRDLMWLVSAIEKREVDFIVAERVDRISRNEIFNLQLIEKCHKNGVELFELDGGLVDWSDKGSRWSYKIKNINAEEYILDLSKNVSIKQREAMVNNGKDPSPCLMLGLDKDPNWVGIYQPNWEEVEILRDIARAFCKNKGARQPTIEYAIEEGYKTKAWFTEKKVEKDGRITPPRKMGGKAFDWYTLLNHLGNPKIRGWNEFYDCWNLFPHLQDNKGMVRWEYAHARKHGDLFDKELRKEVDLYLQKAKTKPRDNEFLLSGILYAPDGSKYGGEAAKSGKNLYYLNRKIGKRISATQAHDAVIKHIKSYMRDSGKLEKIIERAATSTEYGVGKLELDIRRKGTELEKLRRARDNFSVAIQEAAARTDSDLTEVIRTILDQKKQTEDEIVRTESELDTLLEQKQRVAESLKGNHFKKVIGTALAGFDRLEPAEKKSVVKSIVPKAIVRECDEGKILELHVNLLPKPELGSDSAKWPNLGTKKLRGQEAAECPFVKYGRPGQTLDEPLLSI